MAGEDVLEAEIVALKEIMEKGFSHMSQRLDELSRRMANRVRLERFEAWCKRIDRLEQNSRAYDTRLDKLERVNWLLGILGTLAMAVLAAIAIALATGKIAIVVR